jgi:hypothetical protein
VINKNWVVSRKHCDEHKELYVVGLVFGMQCFQSFRSVGSLGEGSSKAILHFCLPTLRDLRRNENFDLIILVVDQFFKAFRLSVFE